MSEARLPPENSVYFRSERLNLRSVRPCASQSVPEKFFRLLVGLT